ncbi:alpha-ketoglutaric semialdehyde dehydrogenase GucD [Alkalihalobacillus sp. AL-G]|uniref:alpha-ketoglutaric semialdehyde dehydrogenase GucD n=1 Tax=Alkalihalobacillus sp. AL-G TaxID=2926399 RepID=UPI00272B425C|nr:alpha-ketoglutaric semialdehyde dehydrogenase GucD [Alkalihalobacillus sp. AL-G]WLD93847.1 aldehyde dehydrogenase family protein [Alkalihalobacillus sp. AL-G]
MTVETTVKTYDNYINGTWTSGETNQVENSYNPANPSEGIGAYHLSSEQDVNSAVEAAKAASKAWRKLAGAQRGDYLYQVANAIEKNLDDIAETMTREMGKTLPESKGETARGVAILRYFAGEGMRSVGDVIPSTDQEALMYTTRVPLGVVGVITPWNFPVAIPIWKMAPALIYGNTVVIKPAQETAVTTTKIIECFNEAGLPNGVVNLVNGKGSVVGQRLIDHPDVKGLTFTGSNNTGQRVAEGALARGAKYQLEMGGKNPVIVADDANLDLAVEGTISGGLRSTGQKCTATSRVIVLAEVYEQFKEKLINEIEKLSVGDGLTEGTWMGPCVSESQLKTVLSYIEKGKEEGATLLYGGKRPEGLGNGYFVEPTVFEKVDSKMAIGQEEIFGPVLALIKAETLEEAFELANDVKFGLSASIYTTNIGNMMDFIEEIDAGLVRVNAETAGVELQAPFGGMKASSSHSREQGQAAKEFFTTLKTVFVKS